jgi:hypothetical protein
MSNKHLACLLLFAVIVGCFQFAKVMNTKLTNAVEARDAAQASLDLARNTRVQAEIQLGRLKSDNEALRKYLALWLPKLQETDDETKARTAFSRIYKQHGEGLVSHADRSNVVGNKDRLFLPKRFQNILSVEGDYGQAVTLIGQIERQMPASRISSLSLTKGTRGNDVKLSLTIDTPMMVKTETPKK